MLAGPFGSLILADLGADVIKIEEPRLGDPTRHNLPKVGGESAYFMSVNRGKRSVCLDLKSDMGKEKFIGLVKRADVVIENFRPGVMERLGIGPHFLHQIRPQLIICSISGFGQDGPLAERPGFDQIAQGMGGLMSITGEPGRGPMRVGIPIADLCAGLFAAQAIFIALLERSKSGKGQWVQTSLLQAQAFMLDFQAARYLMDGDVPKQAGNNHPTSIPTGVFKTSDGFINLAVAGELIWKRLAETFQKPEWCDDERFAINESRSRNRDILNAEIEKITKTQTSTYWVTKLNEAGIPAGDINDIGQVFECPQIQHLGLAQTMASHERGETRAVGQPILMSRTPSHIAAPPPLAGAHVDTILLALGYSPAEIEHLRENAVI